MGEVGRIAGQGRETGDWALCDRVSITRYVERSAHFSPRSECELSLLNPTWTTGETICFPSSHAA